MEILIDDLIKKDSFKNICKKYDDPFFSGTASSNVLYSLIENERSSLKLNDDYSCVLNLFFDCFSLGYFLQKLSKNIKACVYTNFILFDDRAIEKSDILKNYNLSINDIGKKFSTVYSSRYNITVLSLKDDDSKGYLIRNIDIKYLDGRISVSHGKVTAGEFSTNVVISSIPKCKIYKELKDIDDLYLGNFIYFGVDYFLFKTFRIKIYHEMPNTLNFGSFFNSFYIYLLSLVKTSNRAKADSFHLIESLFLNIESNDKIVNIPMQYCFINILIDRFVKSNSLQLISTVKDFRKTIDYRSLSLYDFLKEENLF